VSNRHGREPNRFIIDAFYRGRIFLSYNKNDEFAAQVVEHIEALRARHPRDNFEINCKGGGFEVTRKSDKYGPVVVARYTRPSAKPARIAMPPGHSMTRIAELIFFFSPKTRQRIFEEIVADYRCEMVDAEAKECPPATMRRIRAQYWGAFVIAIALELATGVVGRIVKALKGG